MGSGHPAARAEAAYNLGVMLDEQEDLDGAIEAFRFAAQRGDPDVACDADAWIADLQRKQVS